MAKDKLRVPKKGDRVRTENLKDVFLVVEVRQNPSVADIRMLKGGPVIKDIPWPMLTFLDQEDASQAAARIVREATEEK